MKANETRSLTRFAWLSIATAILTILLKGVAWKLTGSVGLLSDAIESIVNLAGAVMALWMLTLAEQPADDNHAFGHGKAEYFSSAFEGFLILVAAVSIGYTAIERFLHPAALDALGIGILVSVVASVLNAATATILLKAGKQHKSITLEADAHHLMTDVWTSVGVIAGVALVSVTKWLWLDPAVALLVAANIVWTGYRLVRRSIDGLMDSALPADVTTQILDLLAKYDHEQIKCLSLKTREAGGRAFVELILQAPNDWTISVGHDWCSRIEAAVQTVVPNAHVVTHLEPAGDEVNPLDGN